MQRLILTLLFLLPVALMAADNTVILTPGSGVTMRTIDVGSGRQSPLNILGDTSGSAIYGAAGSANSNVLSVQGIASGTNLPVSLTSTTITGTVAATQSGTWTVQPGNTPNTTSWLVKTNDGTNTQILDPCQSATKLYQTISQTANTQLFAGTSAKKTYVCHIMVVGADAENISLVAGTGSVCATSTVAMIGSTTAAAGPNLSANGGFSIGQGGFSVAASTVNADNVCLFQSGSGRVSGVMTYVAQ